MNRPVTITIDVLSVSGLDAAQARVFGRALERTLADLLGTQGYPRPEPARVDGSVALGGIAVRSDQPEQGGKAVARAIYRGLTG